MWARRWTKRTGWAALAGGIAATLLVGAGATRAADGDRMARDLAVMEGILARLCAHEDDGARPAWGGEPAVAGIYVAGYGAVFLMEDCLSGRQPVVVTRTVGVGGGSQATVQRIVQPGSAAADADTSMARLREVVAEFLTGYGGTMGALAEGDRVTVLARRGGGRGLLARLALPLPPLPPLPPEPSGEGPVTIEMEITGEGAAQGGRRAAEMAERIEAVTERLAAPGVVADSVAARAQRALEGAGALRDTLRLQRMAQYWAQAAPPPRLLSATVTRADLSAHRRGQLTDAQLGQRIAFAELETGTEETKTVEIMADILARSIDSGEAGGMPGEGPVAAYCPGLGALFVLDDPP
ncbi:MAG: hypothetical protein ABIL09_18660, partial [Gemmatimonadota bacterium]